MYPAVLPSFHLVEGLWPRLEARVNPESLLVRYLESAAMRRVINGVSEVSSLAVESKQTEVKITLSSNNFAFPLQEVNISDSKMQ